MTVPDIAGRDCEGSKMPREAQRWETLPEWQRRLTVDNSTGNERLATKPSLDPTLSDLALDLIHGPRAEEYAPPEVNLPRIGAAWAAVLGLPEAIPGWKVALMMAGLKIVRAGHKPGDDSLVDACGYLELARELRP